MQIKELSYLMSNLKQSQTFGSNVDKTILNFVQAYLPKNITGNTDLKSIIKHDESFIENDYRAFMPADILLSAKINNQIAYIYVAIAFNPISNQLTNIIIKDCMDAIRKWHSQRLEIEIVDRKNIPAIYPLTFSCDKKAT